MTFSCYMPLFFDLQDRIILIFGGGKVGERKAQLFSQFGQVKVISRDFTPKVQKMAVNKQIELIAAEEILQTAKSLLKNAFIAIICTNDRDKNEKLAKLAKDAGVLRNIVDAPDPGDIIVPSIVRYDELYLAISTQGNAPLISKQLRKRVEKLIEDEYWQEWFQLISWARKETQYHIDGISSRKKVLYTIFEDELVGENVRAKNLPVAMKRAEYLIREHST